jgi:hypothetical protein
VTVSNGTTQRPWVTAVTAVAHTHRQPSAPALATSTNRPIHAEIGKGQLSGEPDRDAQITLFGLVTTASEPIEASGHNGGYARSPRGTPVTLRGWAGGPQWLMWNRLRGCSLAHAGRLCAGIPLKRVAVMRRYLVVANQTLQGAELREELGKPDQRGALFLLRAGPGHQGRRL